MSTVRLLKTRTRTLPSAEYIVVTPKQAQEWLDAAGRNRNLVRSRVDMYAAAMARGDWLVTSQGIAFNEAGELTDGQHRLSAIVQSGVSITLLVVHNTSGRSQLVLDMGLKRTPHDQIGLREGWDVMPVHTAIAKSMITSVGGIGEGYRKAVSRDIQQLDRYFVRHRRAIEFPVETMWRRKIAGLNGVVISPVMAPVARAYYTQDRDKLARFCEVMAKGMADERGDGPAVVLRNWLLANHGKGLSSRKYGDQYIIYKKSEIALAAFLRGDSIERLGQRHLDTELFPLPDDLKWDRAAAKMVKLEEAEANG